MHQIHQNFLLKIALIRTIPNDLEWSTQNPAQLLSSNLRHIISLQDLSNHSFQNKTIHVVGGGSMLSASMMVTDDGEKMRQHVGNDIGRLDHFCHQFPIPYLCTAGHQYLVTDIILATVACGFNPFLCAVNIDSFLIFAPMFNHF